MRIYTSASNPIDFCRHCFPGYDEALEEYGKGEDGPDDRGNCFDHNSIHPDYEDEGYTCEDCNRTLTAKDD